MIRIADKTDAGMLADIIRRSHADVASRFHLTPENCPKHPSNCTTAWIENDLARGVQDFLADWKGDAAGCVALEQASPDIVYLERLSVLPAQRRNGLGRRLVEQVIQDSLPIGEHC